MIAGMKQLGAAVGFTVAMATFAFALQVEKPAAIGNAQDEAAIRSVIDHWRLAWDKFDASFLQGDYADDADWMNAYGSKNKGGPQIVASMAQLFKQPRIQSRRTTWSEPRIRFVRSDVALAYRDYKTVGQKEPDGRESGDRNSHSMWVLVKQDGKWRIASQIISDDKERPGPGASAK